VSPIWQTFHEIIDNRRCDPQIVTAPQLHREHRKAALRASLVREMGAVMPVKAIMQIVPMDESTVRKILEKELPASTPREIAK
jgi:hypothetical protein